MNWAGLVDTAVIGAARAPTGSASGLPGLDQTGLDRTAFDHDDDQARLLDSAAATSRARRAGYRPPLADARTAPAPAEPDPRPEVSLAAQRRLGELLVGGSHELVTEWLRLLAATPWRPPDALLPALLTLASGNRVVRAALTPVLGPLAAWLAAFNDSWAWAAGVDNSKKRERSPEAPGQVSAQEHAEGPGPSGFGVSPDGAVSPRASTEQLAQQFGTGGLAARTELLSRLRAHDPAAARDLLASTWASEPYRDRAALLATFATGLSLDDEPLAELGLADRRVEVRLVAADLLATMAGSRYSAEATERAAAAVRVEQTATRRRLIVTVPDDVTDEPGTGGPGGAGGSGAAREPGVAAIAGILGLNVPAGAGARAWSLQQLAATAPAGFWAGHAGLDLADLLALAERTDWAVPLREGWTRAAIRDTHVGWLTALLDHPARTGRTGRPGEASGLHLLAALPAQARDEWLCANTGSPLFGPALDSLPAPWSARVSDRVRSVLAEVAQAGSGYPQVLRALLRLAALRLEPPAPPQLDPALVDDRLAGGWSDLLSTLSVRAAMRREIAEEPDP